MEANAEEDSIAAFSLEGIPIDAICSNQIIFTQGAIMIITIEITVVMFLVFHLSIPSHLLIPLQQVPTCLWNLMGFMVLVFLPKCDRDEQLNLEADT
jgi:hypothetical protein